VAELAGVTPGETLLVLQTFAVEARDEEGPFHLPAPRVELQQIEALRSDCEAAIETAG
jgi:hypothetical protein